MSTASLPSYHHYEPHTNGAGVYGERPSGQFIKNSRIGGVVLRLSGQRDGAALPEYGRGSRVEGTVEIPVKSTDSVSTVEVKVWNITSYSEDGY